MKIYTGTSWSLKRQKMCAEMNVGMMSSPVDLVHPDRIIPEVDVSADNSAFRCYRDGTLFNESLFYSWCNSIGRNIDFVSLPDIVCGGIASYELSCKHIGNTGFKEYFVVQDGMTFDLVHRALSECSGCFIGGSTVVGKCAGWKWQVAPKEFVQPCHDIGLPVHMGRCPGTNTALFAAMSIGIDSIDTSTLIRNQRLHQVQKFRDHVKEQLRLPVV